jgi:hypothetical protein
MKNSFFRPFYILVLALGTALMFAGCEKNESLDFRPMNDIEADSRDLGDNTRIRDCLRDPDQLRVQDRTHINLKDCKNNLAYLPSQPLSIAEETSILLMRERQKLARDLNLKFFELWDFSVFSKFSNSEQTHMDAMLLLIEHYNLTDPVGANEIGIFTNTSLQTLYNDLLPAGVTSKIEALKVAARIQEIEILELDNALETFVDNDDVEMVYTNLMEASENHLRALVKHLDYLGLNYVPQVLSPEAFAEIMENNWRPGYVGGR